MNQQLKKETQNIPEKSKKVDFAERLGFGLGDLAVNFTWASLGMFVVYFYTDVIGLGAGIVGTIMLTSRFLDGISDVTMGIIVDKTKSKHGKARSWVLWMAIPFALFTVLLFTVPDISYTGKVIYVFISYNVLVLAFTAIVIPYGTLNSLITQDQHEREVLNIYRTFFAQIGVLIVTNLTMPMVGWFGGEQFGWIITYSIFGIAATIFFFITFKTTTERVQPVDKSSTKISIKDSLKTLIENKYWIMVFLFFIIYSMGQGLHQASTIYYAEYILGNTWLVGPLNLAHILPVVIGFLVLSKIFDKFGKRNSMIWGAIISVIGLLITLIEPSSLLIVTLSQIIKGLGLVPLLGGLFALLPDTIEYGEWKTGIRNEGVLYSGGSMGQKIGIGIGSASVGWILSLGGYIGGQAVQSESAITAIFTIFIYLPMAIFIAQIILLYFYKLDKEYPQIVNDLKLRKLEKQ